MAKNKNRQATGSGWIAWAKVVEAFLDRFGWPGFLLIFCLYFVDHNATLDQKHAIIDLYVLGRGIILYYPVFVLGAVSVMAFLAQRHYYRKKLGTKDTELKRLGEWKTQHQEQKIGTSLHHSESKEK